MQGWATKEDVMTSAQVFGVKYLVENGLPEWGKGHMACFRFEATGAVICSLMTLKLSCPIAS